MNSSKDANENHVYETPVLYVGLFYILLAAWTAVCVIVLGSKTIKVGWPLGQLLMIAFILAYTWYFSLGIAYRVSIEDGGKIDLTSFRKKITVVIKDIEMVEGPRLAVMPYCFIRFRLESEKVYLFCRITDEALHCIFYAIKQAKQDMKFKGLQMII